MNQSHRANRRHALNGPARVEGLEGRRLLAAGGAAPSDLEQYLLELVNRARANPAAEAARLKVDLNEGLAAGTISAAAKQPLAINPALVAGARGHSQWMVDQDAFSHTGANGSSPGDRMRAAGYSFTGSWTWGENIAYRSGSVNAALVDKLHADLFVDSGISGRGHRTNLMNASFREVGTGVVAGSFRGYGVGMITEDFAKSGSGVFLTGVAYTDKVTKDDFYTPGEGLGGVTVTAKRLSDGATFTAATWASGGYSLAVPAGTYAVTASGGGLASAVSYGSVVVGSENVKRDFVPGVTSTGGGTGGTPGGTRDRTPPAVALTRAKPLRTGGGRYYNFVVTVSDDGGVDPASLDGSDVLITGPGGYARLAVLNTIDPASTATNKVVNYMVKGPGGRWDAADNGTYTVKLQPAQVADAAGNKAAGVTLGQFVVRIPAAAPAVAVPAVATVSRATPFAASLLHPSEFPVFA